MKLQRIKEPADTIHLQLVFTDEQRANCEKLAEYVADLAVSEEGYHSDITEHDTYRLVKYDMMFYALDLTRKRQLGPQELPLHGCGTSCCLLGHGPLAGIPASPSEAKRPQRDPYDLWQEYMTKFLPKETIRPAELLAYLDGNFHLIRDFCQSNCTYSVESFLFSGDWEMLDNTPQGGALRLWYALDHGVPTWVETHGDRPADFWTNGWMDEWIIFLAKRNIPGHTLAEI